MKYFLPIILLSLVFILSSCGPDYIFDQTVEMNNQEWTYQDTLDFRVGINDTLQIYNLYLDVEHSVDYAYQNIYIQIYTAFPSGQRIKERVSIDLADKGGVWHGQCGKEWCELRVPIQEGAFFNSLGIHTFTIEQYMRKNPLPGIKSIALRIEKTEQSRSM